MIVNLVIHVWFCDGTLASGVRSLVVLSWFGNLVPPLLSVCMLRSITPASQVVDQLGEA